MSENTHVKAASSAEQITAVPERTTRTVRVHLADAPTDVLVYLDSLPVWKWTTVGEIAAACAPGDADYAQATVANALTLLRVMGYVVQSPETRMWACTADGSEAVAKAREALS